MIPLLAGISTLVVVIVYSFCKVASDADDRMEKMRDERVIR